MPPTDNDKAFRWRLEDSYRTVTGAAFAKLVFENGLRTEGPFSDGFKYAMLDTTEGQELYRTPAVDWDLITPISSASANPAISEANILVYTVPAGKRAKLLALSSIYARDANAANVWWTVFIDDGAGQERYGAMCTTPLTASQSWVVNMGIGVAQATANDRIFGGLPDNELLAGWRVYIYFVNDTVGDDSGVVRYIVKEAPA